MILRCGWRGVLFDWLRSVGTGVLDWRCQLVVFSLKFKV